LFILDKKTSLVKISHGIPVIVELTSSYLAISSSTGAIVRAGAGVAAGVGAGGGAGVVIGTILGGSCDKATGFDGEPGLGGREGCRGELINPVEGRKVDGVGSGRGAELSTLMTELTSGVTTMVGGGGRGFAAAALALASAEILSSLFCRSAILPSSNLIFFTKSLTSPGLGIQDKCKISSVQSSKSLTGMGFASL
jgi:hypothetical protein